MAEGGKTKKGNTWLEYLAKMGNDNGLSVTPLKMPQKPENNGGAESSTPTRISPCPITIDIEDVVRDLNIYQRFHLPSLASEIEVTGLPNFDDITLHSVPESVQHHLWKLEARRLVKAVTQKEIPRFIGSSDLAVDSRYGYSILANLADRMLQCLSVVSYDREYLLRKHHRASFSHKIFSDSEEFLEHLLDKEDDHGDGARQRDKAHTAKGRHDDFFAVADYCTAMLARYLCSAVQGKSVHINIIAHIARLSTKIKVVSADMRKSATTSLINGGSRPAMTTADKGDGNDNIYESHNQSTSRDLYQSASRVPNQSVIKVLYQHPSRSRSENLDSPPERASSTYVWVPSRSYERPRRALFSDPGQSAAPEAELKRKLRIMYYEKCGNYQQNLAELLAKLVGHFPGTRLTQVFSTSYEISGMVYETGFECFRTLVYQDGEHNFSGTSDTHIVNYARNAFHLINQAVSDLEDGAGDHSINPGATSQHRNDQNSVGTAISWSYTPNSSDNGPEIMNGHAHTHLELKSMSDVITLLVPLLLADPCFVVSVSAFFGCIAFNKHMRRHSQLTNEHHKVSFKPVIYRKYTGSCSISTREYRDQQQKIRYSDGPRSLSNALMRNNNLYAGHQPTPYSRVNTHLGSANEKMTSSPLLEQSVLEQVESCRNEINQKGEMMRGWVFEEKGVMVNCKTYVAMTMLVAIVLSTSGLAVGVTLGPRISGVDPFNLTTYCWALAAFVILVAKSVRVHEWSWNDFLHCRVLCKSVSELSLVTGIDEQLILAKLVQVERNSILETRGPFNQVFDGNKSGDGFSIDRPIGIWAMLLSGLIMIEVESLDGRRLVCLDLRRGTKLRVVKSQVQKFEVCLYSKEGQVPARTEREGFGEESPGPTKQVHLKRAELAWTRALGLYSNKETFFV